MASREWPTSYEDVLRPHLPLLTGESELETNVSLADLGLDSLGTVSLLVQLEETFDVMIPDELLIAESFSTPGTLWSVIDDLRKGADRSV